MLIAVLPQLATVLAGSTARRNAHSPCFQALPWLVEAIGLIAGDQLEDHVSFPVGFTHGPWLSWTGWIGFLQFQEEHAPLLPLRDEVKAGGLGNLYIVRGVLLA